MKRIVVFGYSVMSLEVMKRLNPKQHSVLFISEDEDEEALISGQGFETIIIDRGSSDGIQRGMPVVTIEGIVGQVVNVSPHYAKVLLAKDPALAQVVKGLLHEQPCPSPDSFYRLRSAGVIAGNSPADARPRCRLYAMFLRRHLL